MKIVLIRGRPREEPKASEEAERFGRFAKALSAAGFASACVAVEDAAGALASIDRERPDLVFCSLTYLREATGRLRNAHGLFEEAGMPYVGASPSAIELAISKSELKDEWRRRGVRTPDYFTVAREGKGAPNDEKIRGASGFPYIVKPAREGNSRGIDADSVARDGAALRGRVDRVLASYGEALVESFLGDDPGMREFTVALIGEPEGGLLMPAEIFFEGDGLLRIVSNEAKDGHKARALPVQDPELAIRLRVFARAAFNVARARDYSRCDLILSGGELYAIEVNGQPMVPDPWFAACAAGEGLDEDCYLRAIVAAALSRLASEGRRGFDPPSALMAGFPPRVARSLARAEKRN